VTTERLRVGIIGCGDVAQRHYLPGIASRADRAALTAVADPDLGAAGRLASAATSWASDARAYGSAEEMLRSEGFDAVFNLTPATLHGAVNRAILEAGVACFSEKPVAASVAEADALIDVSYRNGVLFLCAPGSAATAPFRWLKELTESGRLGRPTLAVAHHADPGPAAWREYTGDPGPFYREGVGPVFDHGIYRLHEMTLILGPVRRVQAMGSIAIPRRRVLGGPRAGETIEVTTPDHVLIQLEFASGALGQLLASFGTLDTLAPWLELHLERGVVSFGGKSWDLDAPVSVYTDDESDAALEGWAGNVEVPRDPYNTVQMGARHFIGCLLGEETPVLTAEHARHVLDVIVMTYASIEDGRGHEIATTFQEAPIRR
jgi:predicted dehydrogenase